MPSPEPGDALALGSSRASPVPSWEALQPAVRAGEPAALGLRVRELQAMSTVPAGTFARRILFLWFRIHVRETKPNGAVERVNLRIPLPIPFVGALLRPRMSGRQALEALARAEADPDALAALGRALDAHMGLELIRVDEQSPARGKSSLVVIGFD